MLIKRKLYSSTILEQREFARFNFGGVLGKVKSIFNRGGGNKLSLGNPSIPTSPVSSNVNSRVRRRFNSNTPSFLKPRENKVINYQPQAQVPGGRSISFGDARSGYNVGNIVSQKTGPLSVNSWKAANRPKVSYRTPGSLSNTTKAPNYVGRSSSAGYTFSPSSSSIPTGFSSSVMSSPLTRPSVKVSASRIVPGSTAVFPTAPGSSPVNMKTHVGNVLSNTPKRNIPARPTNPSAWNGNVRNLNYKGKQLVPTPGSTAVFPTNTSVVDMKTHVGNVLSSVPKRNIPAGPTNPSAWRGNIGNLRYSGNGRQLVPTPGSTVNFPLQTKPKATSTGRGGYTVTTQSSQPRFSSPTMTSEVKINNNKPTNLTPGVVENKLPSVVQPSSSNVPSVVNKGNNPGVVTGQNNGGNNINVTPSNQNTTTRQTSSNSTGGQHNTNSTGGTSSNLGGSNENNTAGGFKIGTGTALAAAGIGTGLGFVGANMINKKEKKDNN